MGNILFCIGARKSGKTTAAQIINEFYPEYRIKSFSSPLKEAFCKEFKIRREILDSPSMKEKYRREMQLYSLEYKKKDPFYFAKKLFDTINSNDNVVIDDGRFLEELELSLQYGAIVIQVYASPEKRRERGWIYDSIIDNDCSETELGYLSWETVDRLGGFRVWNNKPVESLEEQLKTILLKLMQNKLSGII